MIPRITLGRFFSSFIYGKSHENDLTSDLKEETRIKSCKKRELIIKSEKIQDGKTRWLPPLAKTENK